jgi:hypothetical protein
VFKAIVEGARKVGRAVTGGDPELPEGALDLGNTLAQAFVSRRMEAVHALGTTQFQERNPRETFAARWREVILERGPLTGFEVSNVGHIDLGFIPGLEDTPQEAFVAFLEVAFSTPVVPLDDDKAFVVGVVLLDEGGTTKLGAIHTQ